jgi:hypothetical protein
MKNEVYWGDQREALLYVASSEFVPVLLSYSKHNAGAQSLNSNLGSNVVFRINTWPHFCQIYES